MDDGTAIQGTCDGRFAAVRETFAENFAERGEVGAAVAVTLDGVSVVDLWAGHADAGRSRPWERDTIVVVSSTTKGTVAVCMHMLVDQGKVDLDAPVAEYWPEFAQAGKEGVLVRHLLGHTAGLPTLRQFPFESVYDWEAMTSALAAEELFWEPGTEHGYHALTWGWLNGEVIRRASGRSVGAFFGEEVAAPLGVDFFIGVPASEQRRIAEVIPAPPPAECEFNVRAAVMADPESVAALTIGPIWELFPQINSTQFREAELPAANGHGNARALARVYGALARGGEVDGVRLLSGEAIERAIQPQPPFDRADLVLGLPAVRGLGFVRPQPELGDPRPSTTFGHPGLGGSSGWADPAAAIGFGYVANQFQNEGSDERANRLAAAVYASL